MMHRFLPILLLSLILAACNRDAGTIDEVEVTPFVPPSDEPVRGSVIGQVTDHNGTLANATVSLGGSKIITDAEGIFTYTDYELYKDGTYITVSKSGYFDGSRYFYAISDEVHNVKIQLIERRLVQEISANGGRVNLGQQAYTELPSGTYKSSVGGYSGALRVFGKWLDPSLQESYYEMPGSLIGISDEGDVKALTSFGVIKLEIEDNLNNPIALPEGQTAELFFPIVDEDVNYAPEDLTLSYLDVASGLWIADGVAFKNGDFYQAEVDSPGFWHLSHSLDRVSLSGILTLDGMPAGDTEVRILEPDSGFTTYGITSESGRFNLDVPVGQNLIFTVMNDCLNNPFTKILDPIIIDTDLPDPIDLTSGSNEITLTGHVKDCDEQPIAYALIRLGHNNENDIHRANENGEFEITIDACVTEHLSLIAIDTENSMVSELHELVGADKTELNNIRTCITSDYKYSISYSNMNWLDQLMNSAIHDYHYSEIGNSRVILDLKVQNSDATTTYMEGAFDFVKGTDSCAFFITFPTQGFKIFGEMAVEPLTISGAPAYRFHGNMELTEEENLIIENAVGQSLGIENIEMDLVYFK